MCHDFCTINDALFLQPLALAVQTFKQFKQHTVEHEADISGHLQQVLTCVFMTNGPYCTTGSPMG